MMPWGFILASKNPNPDELTPEEIAKRFAARGVQNKYYTPRYHNSVFTLPEYLNEALEAHGRVLTDAEPFIWTA